MGEKKVVSFKGLFTNVNELGNLPEGALLKADGVTIHKPGTLLPIRGKDARIKRIDYATDAYGNRTNGSTKNDSADHIGTNWDNNGFADGSYPVVDAYIGRLFPFKLGFAALGLYKEAFGDDAYPRLYMSDNIVQSDLPGLDWAQYKVNYVPEYTGRNVTYKPPYGDRNFNGFESNGSFYYTTEQGIRTAISPTSGHRAAGIPEAQGLTASLNGEGAGTAIRQDSQVAYRAVFGMRDDNGVLNLGAPTNRVVLVSKNISVATGYARLNVANTWLFCDVAPNSQTWSFNTKVSLLGGPGAPWTGTWYVWGVETITDANLGVMYRIKMASTAFPGVPPAIGTMTNVSTQAMRLTLVGATNALLFANIPYDVEPSKHFIQVYRTPASPSADVDPGDDMGLVYERKLPLANGITGVSIINNGGLYRVYFFYPNDYTKPALNDRLYMRTAMYLKFNKTSGGTQNVPMSGAYPYTVEGVDANGFWIDQSAGTDTGTLAQPLTDEIKYLVKPYKVQISDTVPDGAIGPYLYTSQAVEGIAQANNLPPLARDATIYRSTAFYADIVNKAQIKCTLFAVGSPDGLQINDTITVNGIVFTAGAFESLGLKYFQLYTNEGSAYNNIKKTVQSMAYVMNMVSASYGDSAVNPRFRVVTLEDDFSPGIFYLVHETYGKTLSFSTSRAGVFSPESASVVDTESPNLLAYSKPAMPGAVPALNTLRIGADTKRILKITATREALFVFKEDGTFIVRGYSAPWQEDPFDLSLVVKYPDSVSAIDTNVFGVFTHGVMRLSDSGSELISMPIQNLIEPFLNIDENQPVSGITDFNTIFSVADTADHKWHLVLPPNVGDWIAAPSKVYVWDTITQAWTTYTYPAIHGIFVKNMNKTVWVDKDFNITYESRSYTKNDYYGNFSDPISDRGVVVIPLGGNEIIVRRCNGSTSPIDADGIYIFASTIGDPIPDGTLFRFINTKPGALRKVEVLDSSTPGEETWKIDSDLDHATEPIGNFGWFYKDGLVEFVGAPQYPGDPSALHHFREANVFFGDAYWDNATLKFIRPYEPTDPVTDPEQLGREWELDISGNREFNFSGRGSGIPIKQYQIRAYVPKDAQRTSILYIGMKIPTNMSLLNITGFSTLFNVGPSRSKR